MVNSLALLVKSVTEKSKVTKKKAKAFRRKQRMMNNRLDSLEKQALSEELLQTASPVGSKLNQECNHTGTPCCRRSRATLTGSAQSPSLPTAGRSRPGQATARSGSGTRRRARRCRRSRATLVLSAQSPLHLSSKRNGYSGRAKSSFGFLQNTGPPKCQFIMVWCL